MEDGDVVFVEIGGPPLKGGREEAEDGGSRAGGGHAACSVGVCGGHGAGGAAVGAEPTHSILLLFLLVYRDFGLLLFATILSGNDDAALSES